MIESFVGWPDGGRQTGSDVIRSAAFVEERRFRPSTASRTSTVLQRFPRPRPAGDRRDGICLSVRGISSQNRLCIGFTRSRGSPTKAAQVGVTGSSVERHIDMLARRPRPSPLAFPPLLIAAHRLQPQHRQVRAGALNRVPIRPPAQPVLRLWRGFGHSTALNAIGRAPKRVKALHAAEAPA